VARRNPISGSIDRNSRSDILRRRMTRDGKLSARGKLSEIPTQSANTVPGSDRNEMVVDLG
jgi:hypothetical protein